MLQRFKDFIFSFGMMLLGVALLFFGSVTIKTNEQITLLKLPEAGLRQNGPGGDVNSAPLPLSRPSVPLCKQGAECKVSFSAASIFAVDSKTNSVLYEKNVNEIRPLASITKLMSALVLLDIPINWASTTVITENDYNGSDHHLSPGEKFTADDLWHIALIGSSNSAVNALVRMSNLSADEFVKRMNAKAAQLGFSSMRFSEPTGLSDKNLADARDTARLLKEALKYDKIALTLRIGEYYAHPLQKKKPRRVWTTNWLLTNWIPNKFKSDFIAGKTGYTSDAGYNFVVSLENEKKHPIIVTVLGTTSTEGRFTEARDLANWIFENFTWPDEPGYEKLAE